METEIQQTLKVKVTASRTVKEEIDKEIQIPYYSKLENAYYKIIGDGNYESICVTWYEDESGATRISNMFCFNDALKGEPATELEFSSAYIKAFEQLSNLYQK